MRQSDPTKESSRAETIATSIVITAGERPLYSAEPVEELARGHLALVAQRDALREALEEIAHGFSFGSVHLQEIARAALESPK